MAIDKKTLGKAIRQIRNLRGLSQANLAKDAGIQPNSLALVERGERGVSMEKLNALSAALGVPAACLAVLGAKKIGGSGDSTAFVKSLQRLIFATIVAQVTIEAEEGAEQAKEDHFSEAIDSIPAIEDVLRQLRAKGRTKKRKASPNKTSGKQKAKVDGKQNLEPA